MKILLVTYGSPDDRITDIVELPGEKAASLLTPAMAKRAARIATGGVKGTTVTDTEAGYGYILSSEKRNSYRKFYLDKE